MQTLVIKLTLENGLQQASTGVDPISDGIRGMAAGGGPVAVVVAVREHLGL